MQPHRPPPPHKLIMRFNFGTGNPFLSEKIKFYHKGEITVIRKEQNEKIRAEIRHYIDNAPDRELRIVYRFVVELRS